jgi:hypothetical protein
MVQLEFLEVVSCDFFRRYQSCTKMRREDKQSRKIDLADIVIWRVISDKMMWYFQNNVLVDELLYHTFLGGDEGR